MDKLKEFEAALIFVNNAVSEIRAKSDDGRQKFTPNDFKFLFSSVETLRTSYQELLKEKGLITS